MYWRLFYIILAILLLLFVFDNSMNIENFTNYANINNPSNNTLLSCDYPVKSNVGLSLSSYSQSADKKVITPMSSYTQETNNIRNWKTPNNGTCPFTELCGGIYNSKNFIKDTLTQPNEMSVRVNYYNQ